MAVDWNNLPGTPPDWSDDRWRNPNLSGCVMVAVYATAGGELRAELVPYDGDGNPVEDGKQVVKP